MKQPGASIQAGGIRTMLSDISPPLTQCREPMASVEAPRGWWHRSWVTGTVAAPGQCHKPTSLLHPCANPAASHEVCCDTSKKTKEEPPANLCSDIWPTVTYRCGSTTMELVWRPWSSQSPWLEVTTHQLNHLYHLLAPSPSRLGRWQVKSPQWDLQRRCICSARVPLLAVSVQSLATFASGRLLAFTFNLTFTH